MEPTSKRHKAHYNRVMARVYSKSRFNSRPSFSVTRHDPTSSRVGGKPSVSNVSSSVFSELPLVLDDYIPDEKVPRKTTVVKPKRTLKSLDPVKPVVSVNRPGEVHGRTRNIRVPASMPSVLNNEAVGWSDSHVRQCFSSRSHSKLQELKTEIKAYKEKEDFLKLQSRLYKRCGIVFDGAGHVAEDKAVQAEGLDSTPRDDKKNVFLLDRL